MKRFILTLAMLTIAVATKAQVSYLDVAMERMTHTDFRSPASLTPVPGTHKYMDITGNKVVLFDYDKESAGEEKFTHEHALKSYDKSPSGTMAIYEIYDNVWPRKEIYRHSYTSTYYIACPDGSTIKIDDVRDISFSPDNRHLAMSYNNDLFIYDLSNNEIYNITDDGKWNHIINGTTDWV